METNILVFNTIMLSVVDHIFVDSKVTIHKDEGACVLSIWIVLCNWKKKRVAYEGACVVSI